jgi:hypothetical protein
MSKLTYRDLFAIVTIVALALGWWLDHRRRPVERIKAIVSDYRTMKEVLEENGFRVVDTEGEEVLITGPSGERVLFIPPDDRIDLMRHPN